MPEIDFDDFVAVDMRVGRVVEVEEFPEARKPAWKLRIDFGPELGVKRSSARITISASRKAVLPIIVTNEIAAWKRSMITKCSSSPAAARTTDTPGERAPSSRAKASASAGSFSAMLIAPTLSAAPASPGSAASASRSGRCRRASSRLAVKRDGSGVGSYTPAMRKGRAFTPRASAESITTCPR